MRKEKYKDIYENNLIMTYEKDDEITKELSWMCDGRVVWGGDETIKKMQQYPLKISVADLTFPDRNSIAVFDLSDIKNRKREEKEDLAYRFYNDTLLMDQNACSSPRLLYWLNRDDEISETESKRIREEWWQIFYQVSAKYDLTPWKASRKYEQICYEIMEYEQIDQVKQYENKVYVSSLKQKPQSAGYYQGRFGCFYEYEIKSLSEICTILEKKIQTIVYEGIDPKELVTEIIGSGSRGADRIVKAGNALELDRIWDGKDIIKSLSRIIQIK